MHVASPIRWAILCLKWHFSVRRTDGRIGDYAPDVQAAAAAGGKNHHQARNGQQSAQQQRHGDVNIELMAIAGSSAATTSAAVSAKANRPRTLRSRMLRHSEPVLAYCSLTHLVAWGLPLVQTVAVVMAQLVDADELLGECVKRRA